MHARAKFNEAKCSGSCVIVLTVKIGDDAENNTDCRRFRGRNKIPDAASQASEGASVS